MEELKEQGSTHPLLPKAVIVTQKRGLENVLGEMTEELTFYAPTKSSFTANA